LGPDNVTQYWQRESRYDTVINLSFGHHALDALARVLETWVHHMLGVPVSIQPVQEISDERWVWHTGLDVPSSALLNDLYNAVEVDESRIANLLALFRLEFTESAVMRSDIEGRPVYLGMAMDDSRTLKMKPQNLLLNLPLAAQS